MYPSEVRHCVVIASALKLTAQNIAFNEVARQAIVSDRDFHEGHYLAHNTIPRNGLRLARMIGHLTYLSEGGMGERFGRDLKEGDFNLGSDNDVEFQIESYLRYQGDIFSESFDANTYILMTHALDYFDLAREYGDDPVAAFKHSQCSYFVVSFTTDWRFSPARSREIVDALIAAKRPVSYTEIEANFGHDAFLLPNHRYEQAFKAYMQGIAGERSQCV
jgi:homoserine O-acetyltransferase